jgi:hypothetical protein
MSSFFTSADKIKVGQTQVAVPSENGLDYKAGGRIDIFIPPTSKFIDLSKTRLKFNVSLTGVGTSASANLMRLQLDAQTGGHSLIRSIRIFTGRKTALLEEIEGYDVLTALRFDYETNENYKAKRAITDGATNYDPACRGNDGQQKTIQGNCVSNQWFDKHNTTEAPNAAVNTYSATDLNTAKCELSLNTGLFRNEAVFPALLTDGLFIEILLQDKNRIFRSLDTTSAYRQIRLNPTFHSINGVDSTSWTAGANPWNNGDTHKSFYLTRNNNMTAVENCPFKIGERVQLATALATGEGATAGTIQYNCFTAPGIISAIEWVAIANPSTDKIKITFEALVGNDSGYDLCSNLRQYAWLYSSLDTGTDIVSTAADYTVSNVEMVVEHIQVPQGYEQSMINMMKEGGTINYDYRSFTNYRYSQLKGDNFANIRLPLIESRATSILCIPTDAKNYNIMEHLSASNTYLMNASFAVNNESYYNRSCRPSITGIADSIQAYQLIYDGKLNPSRRVDTSKVSSRTSISQQWLIEAEKALAMADIEPLSFLQFQENFFIGRALALGRNSVYDARGKDFNLQVEYTGDAQLHDKLWQCFCSHIRRLEIKNGGVSVMV